MTCDVALWNFRYRLHPQALFCTRVRSCRPGFAVLVSAEMLLLCHWELRMDLYRYCSSPVGHLHRQLSHPNIILVLNGSLWACKALWVKIAFKMLGCFDSPPAMRFTVAVNCTQPSNLSPFLCQTLPSLLNVVVLEASVVLVCVL